MKVIAYIFLALFVAFVLAALCSCGGLYGPNPQPPPMSASEVSDRQPTYSWDGYEPGAHECHE